MVNILILSLLATVAFSIIMYGAIGIHLTRLNIPFLLGTFLTANRSKALIIGFFLHFLLGFVFTFVYLLIMVSMNWLSIWFGLFLGLFQALFVLTVFYAILPKFHPRMASENWGPQEAKLLEPPGFLGMNYGYITPIVILIAHAVFGLIVGMIAFV